MDDEFFAEIYLTVFAIFVIGLATGFFIGNL